MTTEAPNKNGNQMATRDEKGRFVKGWAGGPGRPRNEESITNLLRCEVSERPDFVRSLVDKAEEDWRCAAWIIEHLEPTQKGADLNVNVAVGVQLVWQDGSEA